MKENKFCQSCGMPLNFRGQDFRGSEIGLEKSSNYCAYCYGNGAFLEPNITLDDMINKGRSGIKNGKGNPIMKKIMNWMYPMQLKQLERWKKRS